MNSPINLMLVGEHKLYRECLALSLEEKPQFRVLAQADDVRAALGRLNKLAPDVLLVDCGRTKDGGLAQIRELTDHSPRVKVVAYGLRKDDKDILHCIEAGAGAYVLRESTVADLALAIERARKGVAAYPPRVLKLLFSRLAELSSAQRRRCSLVALELTPREIEILALIAEKLSNRQIAERLCLSLHTVKNHVHHILCKLEVRHRAEAVEKAYNRRWLWGAGAPSTRQPEAW